MREERLEVSRHLRRVARLHRQRHRAAVAPVVALSLCGLRRKIEIELRSLTNGLPSRTNVCTRRKRTCGPQGGSPGLDPKRTLCGYSATC
jgi:hypothetical protein